MTTQLSKLKAIEVSVVPQGANKQNFLILKEESGMAGKNQSIDEVLKANGFDRTLDAAVLKKFDEILKSVASEKGKNAVKAAMRVLHAAGDDVPKEVMAKLAEAAGFMPEADDHKEPDADDKGGPSDNDADNKPAAAEPKKEDAPAPAPGSEAAGDQPPKEKKEAEGMGMATCKSAVKKNADGSLDLTGVPASMHGMLTALWKSHEESEQAVAKANAELAKERDARITKEFVEKAAEFKGLALKSEDLGAVLKTVSQKAPEVFEKLNGILKSLDARIAKGGAILKEVGTSAPGAAIEGAAGMTEAEVQLRQIADGMVAKSAEGNTPITKAQAFRAACNAHPDLYSKHLEESERRKKRA